MTVIYQDLFDRSYAFPDDVTKEILAFDCSGLPYPIAHYYSIFRSNFPILDKTPGFVLNEGASIETLHKLVCATVSFVAMIMLADSASALSYLSGLKKWWGDEEKENDHLALREFVRKALDLTLNSTDNELRRMVQVITYLSWTGANPEPYQPPGSFHVKSLIDGRARNVKFASLPELVSPLFRFLPLLRERLWNSDGTLITCLSDMVGRAEELDARLEEFQWIMHGDAEEDRQAPEEIITGAELALRFDAERKDAQSRMEQRMEEAVSIKNGRCAIDAIAAEVLIWIPLIHTLIDRIRPLFIDWQIMSVYGKVMPMFWTGPCPSPSLPFRSKSFEWPCGRMPTYLFNTTERGDKIMRLDPFLTIEENWKYDFPDHACTPLSQGKLRYLLKELAYWESGAQETEPSGEPKPQAVPWLHVLKRFSETGNMPDLSPGD